jgi:hypothetical protein
MTAKVNANGLLIPKEMLEGMEEVVIIRRESEIIIKSKQTMTRQLQGRIKSLLTVDEALDAYLENSLEGIRNGTE